MTIFFSLLLPMFAGGFALGASLMWCLCRHWMRTRKR